jgi:hypothetical protein
LSLSLTFLHHIPVHTSTHSPCMLHAPPFSFFSI